MCAAKATTGLMILLSLTTADALAGSLPAAILERLRADHSALQEAERDFQRQRLRNSLGAEETADYAAYLDRLRERVAQDCVALLGSGVAPLPPDLPCAAFALTGPTAASVETGAEQTPQERTGALDAQLDSALSEFDEMLLREQERVKAATPRSAESGGGLSGQGEAGGHSGQAGGGAGQQGEAGEMADAGGAAPAGTTGAGSRGAPGNSGGQGGSAGAGGREGMPRQAGGQPADIPDGSDDDVVARQLREAAEKEKDPELRKKLWDEYRKYKQGTR